MITTIGLFSLVGWQFDLSVLGAVLAVLGHSLNDKIVLYDRIRENFRLVRRGSAESIVNTSVNQVLSRTIVTSGSTMLVVIALAVARRRDAVRLLDRADLRHRRRRLFLDLRRERDGAAAESLADGPRRREGGAGRQHALTRGARSARRHEDARLVCGAHNRARAVLSSRRQKRERGKPCQPRTFASVPRRPRVARDRRARAALSHRRSPPPRRRRCRRSSSKRSGSSALGRATRPRTSCSRAE